MGEQFDREEIFLPTAASAAREGGTMLKERLVKSGMSVRTIPHRCSQWRYPRNRENIAAALLQAGGFGVIDLGVDVPVETFIEAVKREKADVLGLSALLSLTMPVQKLAIDVLKKEGLRNRIRLMIEGPQVTQDWTETGADDYATDAMKRIGKAKFPNPN